jgi:DNA-binding NarL/FixJ family response regulator
VEAGIARVQAAQAIALAGTGGASSGWEAYRTAGREALRAAGLDPVVHAYLCDQVIAMGRAARLEPKLTGREVEVLAALADGLTYREVGVRLGIEWRTVRAHSHHIYSKLGASGKVRAIAAARALRIL